MLSLNAVRFIATPCLFGVLTACVAVGELETSSSATAQATPAPKPAQPQTSDEGDAPKDTIFTFKPSEGDSSGNGESGDGSGESETPADPTLPTPIDPPTPIAADCSAGAIAAAGYTDCDTGAPIDVAAFCTGKPVAIVIHKYCPYCFDDTEEILDAAELAGFDAYVNPSRSFSTHAGYSGRKICGGPSAVTPDRFGTFTTSGVQRRYTASTFSAKHEARGVWYLNTYVGELPDMSDAYDEAL